MTKRPTVRMDEDLREKVKQFSKDNGVLMPKGYAMLMETGLDSYDGSNVRLPKDVPDDSSLIEVDFFGHLMRRIRFFYKRHQLMRPIAYYLLIKKGLEEKGY